MTIYGSTLNTLQVKSGFGRHIEYLLPDVSRITMYTTIIEIENGIGTFLVKTSVCLFVLRLIRGTHPKIRVMLWVNIVVLLTDTLATLTVLGLQCIPFHKTWHPEVHGTCIPKPILTSVIRSYGSKTYCRVLRCWSLTISLSVIGTLTDFVCVIIPTFIIRSLQMDKRTKIAMIAVISLGFM